MAGNYTTVIEHKKITIIPYLKIQVRGVGVLLIILGIHIPLFLLTFVIPESFQSFFMLFVILSCLGSFVLAENTNRDKTDHISPSKKFYYQHLKRYRKMNVMGQSYFLRGKRPFIPIEIERRKKFWKRSIKVS